MTYKSLETLGNRGLKTFLFLESIKKYKLFKFENYYTSQVLILLPKYEITPQIII